MQIVIDIHEKDYQSMKNGHIPYSVLSTIMNGTPLPKGHGKIFEENCIKRSIKNPYQYRTVLDGLELVKPIIEADKAESEDKE